LDNADKIIDLQQKREDSRVASVTESRLSILEQQRKDHDQVVPLLEELQIKLDKDIADKRKKEKQLVQQRDQLQRLDYHLVEWRSAQDLIEGRSPNTELEQKTASAAEQQEIVERQKQELQRLQASYGQRLQAIGNIYDGLIKSALSDTYSGTLRMSKSELQFQIEEATGLTGEAVETLALVLADVAAMMCSCQGIGHHPRFLLHDSPREADLDSAHLQSLFAGHDDSVDKTRWRGGRTISIHHHHNESPTGEPATGDLPPTRSSSTDQHALRLRAKEPGIASYD